MHARVATAQVQPGKMEELVSIYRGPVVAAGEGMPGFRGSFLLTDSRTNKVISVALWESEADMLAGEASDYYKQQIGRVATGLAAPPVTEHFEVSVFETR